MSRPDTGDPLLRAFLDAETEEAALGALDALLGGDTDRALRDAVRRALRAHGANVMHADDVVSEARLRLMSRLLALRRGAGDSIENLLGYAASTAENVCYAFLRQRYPERTRFRNRVRYTVARHAGTRLVKDEHGEWQCGTTRPVAARAGAARAFLENPRAWADGVDLDRTLPLPDLVNAVLARLDEGIELDRLVEGLAAILGVADAHRLVPRSHAPDIVEQLPDPAPGAGDMLESREALDTVWREIVDLPPRQRAALLLNLRDPEGGAVLHLLPATGVVSFAAIARVLDLQVPELERLWDSLPLDDLSIAARFGLSRQQVINLRKSARARLARRLRERPAL
ncbi:MAG: hypothetical protein FJW14_13255 [Acidimicrobiia bacterium]|nr:hypothetical protein [Acidimicrobiia bacterium]